MNVQYHAITAVTQDPPKVANHVMSWRQPKIYSMNLNLRDKPDLVVDCLETSYIKIQCSLNKGTALKQD